jgi:hypothetical protein
MSSPVFVPFDYCPVSTTKKTSSYTIPTGQYAEIIPIYTNLAINAVDVGIKYTLTSGNLSVSNSASFGPSTPFVYQMDWTMSGSGVDYVTVNGGVGQIGRPSGSANSGSFTATNTVGGGSMTFTAGNDTFGYTIYTWTLPEHKIWVKAGDVITGAGFWVSLYNKPS